MGAAAAGFAVGPFCSLKISGDVNIVASQVYHYLVDAAAVIELLGGTTTLTGTPAFSGAFAAAYNGACIKGQSVTYTGAATGRRYDVQLNGVVNTNGAGANYFPGSTAGSTATGGAYV